MEVICHKVACKGKDTCDTFKRNYEIEWDKYEDEYKSAIGGYEFKKGGCRIFYYDKNYEAVSKDNDIAIINRRNSGLRFNILYKL